MDFLFWGEGCGGAKHTIQSKTVSINPFEDERQSPTVVPQPSVKIYLMQSCACGSLRIEGSEVASSNIEERKMEG